MPSLCVENLTFSHSGAPLFENVSFSLEAGRKCALVGANGAGKSTLLALLAGQLQPDAGKITRDGEVIFISQVAPELDEEERDLTAEDWLLEKAAEGALEFDLVYNALRALRLPSDTAMGALSEGQRFKLHLCSSLFRSGCSTVLLDEPTSHLDLASVLWLQQFVATSNLAYVIVSHDVRFLEAVADTVLELDITTHTLRATTASFEDYLKERGIRQRMAEANAAARQRRAAALEADVARLTAAGVKGSHFERKDHDLLQRDFKRDRAGRSLHAAGVKERQRQRKLAEAKDEDVPGDGVPFNIMETLESVYGTAASVQHDASHSLSIVDGVIGHPEEGAPRFGPMTLSISAGEKVCLLGPNGCGKSTLLSTLFGDLPVVEGKVEKGRDARVGWLRQADGCGMDPSQTPMGLIAPKKAGAAVEKHLKALTSIGIPLKSANVPISSLSPGMKIRLALLDLMLDKVNFLLLDEVTNYVDRAAKEALLDFLPSFPGAVVVVTHDRELLESVPWTRIVDMGTGRLDELSSADLEQQIGISLEEAEAAAKILHH